MKKTMKCLTLSELSSSEKNLILGGKDATIGRDQLSKDSTTGRDSRLKDSTTGRDSKN